MDLYRPHVDKYDESSVAQLCPSKHDFESLTIKGLDLVCQRDNDKVTVFIHTIDQLRGLFEVLDETPSIRVFIHGTPKDTRVRVDLRVLREQLNSWANSFNGQHQQESQ